MASGLRAAGRMAVNLQRLNALGRQMAKLGQASTWVKAGRPFVRAYRPVAKTFRPAFRAVGRGLRSKKGKSWRHGLQIVSDGTQLGYASYEIVKEVKSAIAAKAAKDKLNRIRESRMKKKKKEEEGQEGEQRQQQKEEEQQQQQQQQREEGEEGEPESDWYYVDSQTGETVWLDSLEEALQVHELGEEVFVSQEAQEELLLATGGGGGEEEEGGGKRRRRRGAEEGEEEEGGWWFYLDPEAEGGRVQLANTPQAYDAYLEGREVLFVDAMGGYEYKLETGEDGEVLVTPLVDDDYDDDGEDEEEGEGEMSWDEWEAQCYEERDPERLVRLYLEDPGKGTMSDLGLIAGASYVEKYVSETMTPEERARWNSVYPNWRLEIRDEDEETQELMRKYLFKPSVPNLEEAVYHLGMDFVRDYAEEKGDVLRQDPANATVWQTTARLLGDRMVGDDLINRHMDDPESYPLREVAEQLGSEYVLDFTERMAWHAEKFRPAMEEDREDVLEDLALMMMEMQTPVPLTAIKAIVRHLEGYPREHPLPGPDWRTGFAARRRQWPFVWAKRTERGSRL